MPKRSSKKKPADLNRLAFSIVEEVTKESEPTEEVPSETYEPGKNPHAAALGRLEGKKGGPARAAKLTAEQRKEIAKKAAWARWPSKRDTWQSPRSPVQL